MSNLIAIAYPDEATAHDVAATLQQLQKEQTIQLDDMVVAIREPDGKMKLKQSVKLTGIGATSGALWGGLIGLIFLAPLLGMAIGAASGAAGAAMADYGIDDKFMKGLADRVPSGGAVLFVLVRQSTPDKVLPRISQYGGEVVHTSLDTDTEEMLQASLREGAHASA